LIVCHNHGGRIENHKFENCDHQKLLEDAPNGARRDKWRVTEMLLSVGQIDITLSSSVQI
jgi:hypothetical protein